MKTLIRLHSCFPMCPDIQMKYSKIQRKKNKGLCPVIHFFLFCLIMGGIGVDVSKQLQTNKNYFRPKQHFHYLKQNTIKKKSACACACHMFPRGHFLMQRPIKATCPDNNLFQRIMALLSCYLSVSYRHTCACIQ